MIAEAVQAVQSARVNASVGTTGAERWRSGRMHRTIRRRSAWEHGGGVNALPDSKQIGWLGPPGTAGRCFPRDHWVSVPAAHGRRADLFRPAFFVRSRTDILVRHDSYNRCSLSVTFNPGPLVWPALFHDGQECPSYLRHLNHRQRTGWQHGWHGEADPRVAACSPSTIQMFRNATGLP